MVISRPQVWRHFSGRDGTRVYMDAVAPSFFSWQGANGMGRNSALKILCFFFPWFIHQFPVNSGQNFG